MAAYFEEYEAPEKTGLTAVHHSDFNPSEPWHRPQPVS